MLFLILRATHKLPWTLKILFKCPPEAKVSPQLRTAGQRRLEWGCKRGRTMSGLYDDSSRARDEIDGQNAKQRLGRGRIWRGRLRGCPAHTTPHGPHPNN